jgi:hypothetical protein
MARGYGQATLEPFPKFKPTSLSRGASGCRPRAGLDALYDAWNNAGEAMGETIEVIRNTEATGLLGILVKFLALPPDPEQEDSYAWPSQSSPHEGRLSNFGMPLRHVWPRTQLHMSGAAEPRMWSDMACHDRRESCRVRRSSVSPPSDVKVRTEQ